MCAMASDVVTVHRPQRLIEFALVEVRMFLGTKPFTKVLHGFAALRLHILPAKRATLTKEPCEAIHEHTSTLPRRIPNGAHRCTTIRPTCWLASVWSPCFAKAREMPDHLADAEQLSLLTLAEILRHKLLSESVQGYPAWRRSQRAGYDCHGPVEVSGHLSGMTALVRSRHQGETVVDAHRGGRVSCS